MNGIPTLVSWYLYYRNSRRSKKQLQTSLQENESIITKDGIWFGSHWIRISKMYDIQSGFLFREQ